MAVQVLDGSRVTVGVGLENDWEGINDPGDTADLDWGEYMGALYGAGPGAAQNTPPPLYTCELVTDCSFDAFEVEIEDIQTLADNYTLPRQIKTGGSVTITMLAYNDTKTGVDSATTVDAFNWNWAYLNLPFGCLNTAAAGPATYSVLNDTPTGDRTDDMGYAVEVVVDSLVKFVFHNCRLEVSCDVGFQKGMKVTAKFTDARFIEILNSTAITTHLKA